MFFFLSSFNVTESFKQISYFTSETIIFRFHEWLFTHKNTPRKKTVQESVNSSKQMF